MRPTLVALAVALAAATAMAPATAQVDAPVGLSPASQIGLASGVEYTHLRGTGRHDLSVHVGRIHPHAAVALAPVVAGDGIAGGLEPTSALCRRANCLLAVNADFFHEAQGQPVGGVVVAGEMLRSPVASHHQLMVGPDRRMSAATLAWSAQLMPSDLRPLAIGGVNVERGEDGLVLYTPAFGASTATNRFGHEVVLRVVDPAGPVRLGETSLVEVVSFALAAGDTPIPADGLVLSGHGAGAVALADLEARMAESVASRRALLRIETPSPVTSSVGGSPVLVREGRRFVGDDGSAFVARRHPRTMMGWTERGEVLLVAIDGRQPGYSDGATLAEAADLMISLGAVEAINLDGGGSTTFVVAGRVANRPSDGAERPVKVGLAVVAGETDARGAIDPLARGVALPSRGTRTELALHAVDPASDPTRRLHDIGLVTPSPVAVWPFASAAAALLASVTTAAVPIGARWRRRRRRLRRSGRPGRR